MKLSESTAVIRPRSGWEAIDLGIRMVQRDFWPLCRRWIIATLPWYALFVSSAHLMGNIGLGTVLFWTMKPAFDRVVLDYLSQRLFSDKVEDPGPFDLWFRLPLSASVWRQLTYLRFSLVRTFTLPVYQLEGVNSGTRERIATLINRDYGASACLTIAFALLTYFLLYVILGMLSDWLHPTPELLAENGFLDSMLEADELFTGPLLWLHLAIFYIVIGLFELFFVGAGFALYINRRTHLEAWDIELSFRRLADRLSRGAASSLAVLGLMFVLSPTPAHAQDEFEASNETGVQLPSTEEARRTVTSIYAGDEFGEYINDRVWRPKEQEPDVSEDDINLFGAVGPFVAMLASLIKYIVVGLFVVAIGLWLYRERKRLLGRSRKAAIGGDKPLIADVAEAEEFIPDANVPDVVMNLWSAGKARDSMSYLYRSALSYLVSRHALRIGDHATEEDCLKLVQANAREDVSAYFADITRQWRLLAYGKRTPADFAVEDLCSRWSHIAGTPTEAATVQETSAAEAKPRA